MHLDPWHFGGKGGRSVSSRPGWTIAQDSRDLGYLAGLREMGRVSKKRKEGREEKK